MVWLLTLSCSSLICGPGTTERDQVCLASTDAEADADTDTDTDTDADTDADTDTDTDTDTDADTDSGLSVEVLEVYILAGQSNMDGLSWYPGLTPEQQLADERVPLYWSGWGEFRALQAASTYGSIYFGPEVTFGRTLADAGREVALVKHAVGGTDLASYWYPGAEPGDDSAGPGFSVLTDSIAEAQQLLDAQGQPWQWAGFIWMQGESDSLDATMADAYADNLTGLIDAVREVTERPELPVAVGLIARESIWTHADTVRAAQQSIADATPNVVSVETDDLQRNELDLAHYDGPSMRVLGTRFARAMLEGEDITAGGDAPEAALSVSSGSTEYDFTGTCGWALSIETPITLTDIGSYGASYLGTSADVGIWDEEGSLVLRTNVPSWYDAPATWRDSFWYVAIEPVVLEPGSYRIGVVSWTGDSDQYLTHASGSFASGITYTAGVYATGSWLTYPSNTYSADSISYVGPSFLFTR